jgi:DNA transformation protein
MENLESLPNIGKEMVKKLNEVGIRTPKELKAIGAEQAFLRLKALDSGACFSMLCGIEGAIQGIRWHNLPAERKQELKQFLKMIQ